MEIYLITNKIDGKQYVGLTTRTSKDRFAEHLVGDQLIDKEIQKYGVDNFSLKVLCCPKTIESLREQEEYWAKKLNTYWPNGYNIARCGTNAIHSLPKEASYVIAARKSFDEFVEFCFKKQYNLTSQSQPIKMWFPYFNDVCEDVDYEQIGKNVMFFRSVNCATKNYFYFDDMLYFISRDSILKSIKENIPISIRFNDNSSACTFRCDKNGIPIDYIWMCASYISKDEYNQYITQQKQKIIDDNIESYKRLYDIYSKKSDAEISEYMKNRSASLKKNEQNNKKAKQVSKNTIKKQKEKTSNKVKKANKSKKANKNKKQSVSKYKHVRKHKTY